jgi:predicted ATPase
MNSIKKILECEVIAVNKLLKETVTSMDYITLLRNMHPISSSYYANQLLNLNIISKDEAKEFIKIVTYPQ